MTTQEARRRAILPAAALILIALHLILLYTGRPALAQNISMPMLVLCAVPLVLQTAREALRCHFATDAVATISIATSIILQQPVPGLIIVLMQSGGEALEAAAQRRASRALSLLEARAPRVAQKWMNGSHVDVPIAQVAVGDMLMILPGNIVPVDGVVESGESTLDTATITGEPLPLAASTGTRVYSGFVNGNRPLVMRVTAVAAESQYERIVQLVKSAQAHKAPLQRMADRYAVWFTPLVIAAAVLTYAFTHDPMRVLAVLVVATPCPLIIAAPVAIIAGINSGARIAVLFRNGSALEGMASVRAALFDKTGTLTLGRPSVVEVVRVASIPAADLLELAASVEVSSSHALAREIVAYADTHGAQRRAAEKVHESIGAGISGVVDGRRVSVGSQAYVQALAHEWKPKNGSALLRSWIAVDDEPAGYVEYNDTLRPAVADMMRNLRSAGVRHIEIVSGDAPSSVAAIAAGLDVDAFTGGLKPEEKLNRVAGARAAHGPVAMIGDGTNDAPALAAADVGIAVTPRGGGIAAETADVILLGDDVSKIPDAIMIARRSLHIARQSIVAGIALSIIGMAAALMGWLPPVPAALTQEAIDVAVIINALRAARPA
jgi:heavy metal translocating P-type ATPase